MRSSLLLSSILLNSEAWVNLSHQNVRQLEQMDEMLLSRILECEANTSNAMKYLELGVYPIRFELMKRSVLFLQYILKQNKSSMIYQVLKATWENPIKNDFVKMCQKHLSDLDINLSFSEIENMAHWSFKNLVKVKTEKADFYYLLEQKAKQLKTLDTSKVKYLRLSFFTTRLYANCTVQYVV